MIADTAIALPKNRITPPRAPPASATGGLPRFVANSSEAQADANNERGDAQVAEVEEQLTRRPLAGHVFTDHGRGNC